MLLTNASIKDDMADAIGEHYMLRSDTIGLRPFDKITHY